MKNHNKSQQVFAVGWVEEELWALKKPQKIELLRLFRKVVRQGFEPRQTVPKTVVLPLHHRTFHHFGIAKVKRTNNFAKLFLNNFFCYVCM